MKFFTPVAGWSRSPSVSYRRNILYPALILGLFLLLPGCSDSKTSPQSGVGPVPVSIATSVQKDIPVEVKAVGSVEPFASVGIKSQVAGILEEVGFKEGDPVKVGDLLFRIDARPYLARLKQAQAVLTRDVVALDNARAQAERYLPAAAKGYVSSEQSEQMQTSVASLSAAVQEDKAALENARLDLENCSIRSPISGYTGELSVNRGNLIKAADAQPLVTVNQITPIKVNFTLPELLLPEVKKYLNAGTLEVVAEFPGDSSKPLNGKISFLDNSVNSATGSIRLKADFENLDLHLWPGQFVNIRLRLKTVKDATVVPARAVQASQDGDIVYVVTGDQTVELRPVRVAFSAEDQSVIAAGLAVGETVVTDGQLRLRDGVKVKAVDETSVNAVPKAAQ